MAINSTHPGYDGMSPDWVLCRDTYHGERVVKDKTTDYLPATSGMVLDGYPTAGSNGAEAYDAYKLRAVFHDFFEMAVRRAIGIMHQKPPVIELPPTMEFLRARATPQGESLEALLRKINREQLITGRVGLLGDMPADRRDTADLYIATYAAERIINWRDGTAQPGDDVALEMVVLDESGYDMQTDLSWKETSRYRVLAMTEGSYGFVTLDEGDQFAPEQLTIPDINTTPADQIPFVFINSADILSRPDRPPMLGLARLALTIYRGEADYRQSLFMQGQDTLVTIGEIMASEDPNPDGQPVRTGRGAHIKMELEGDAKYVGVESEGLAEQREALAADKKEAGNKALELYEAPEGQSGEASGRALNIRVAGKTFTLHDLADTGAGGLESELKILAVWMGADPELVSVAPNKDFVDEELMGQDMVQWMTSKSLGLPLSNRSIHERLRRGEYTTMTYEDELKAIEEEERIPEGTGAGGDGPPDA